jgi:hypothetical protein
LIITCVYNNIVVVVVAVDVHVVIAVIAIVAVAAMIDVDKGVAGVDSSGPTRPDRLLHLGSISSTFYEQLVHAADPIKD